MAETIIDLKGNVVVADEFRGTVTGDVTPGDITLPAITVAGTTVGPGDLIDVIEDLVALINTKADA
jgi:hypothetical protein